MDLMQTFINAIVLIGFAGFIFWFIFLRRDSR